MTIKKSDIGLGRIGIFGQPYHGLWQGGAIALPNRNLKPAPTPANGGCVLIRVPGVTPVTRTIDEAAADAAAGYEWRDYALISGGYYGGIGPFCSNDTFAYLIFVDTAKVRWQVRIGKSGTSNRLSLSFRRLCHIGGPDVGWSAATDVACQNTFWSQVSSLVNPPIIVAQNTRGDEFVLGGVVPGGFAEAMMLCTLTGTVDLSAAGYGVTFGTTMLDYNNRPNISGVHTRTVTGKCRVVVTEKYIQYDYATNAPTGNIYYFIATTVDGVYSNNGHPAEEPGKWWSVSFESVEFPADKIITKTTNQIVEKNVWAAYLEDELVLYSLAHVTSYTETLTAYWLDDGTSGWNVRGHWNAAGLSVGSTVLESRMGGVVAHSHTVSSSSEPIDDQVSSGVSGDNFGYDDLDGYSSSTPFGSGSWNAATILDNSRVFFEEGGGGSKVTYMVRIGPHLNRWSSPVMVVCERSSLNASPGVFTWTPLSVWAPSGKNELTDLPFETLHASWQPVLNELVVSDEPVCWF